MSDLDWLIARPVAHRGLHDAASGIIENTASAFTAAIAGRYAIETDLQISADGEAMVHHDDAFGRLTEGSGRLSEITAADIKKVHFKATTDRVLTLAELCDLVGGRAALFLELKSHNDGDRRLPQRCAEVLASYKGSAAVMSFDPILVEAAREIVPSMPRGMIAEGQLTSLHLMRTRPHFIAYSVNDLPAWGTLIAHTLLRRPLLTWTVHSEADRQRAARWADQIIFEGIRP